MVPSEREFRAGFHHNSSKHTCVRSSANPAKGWGQRARPLSRKSLLWSASLLMQLTETHEAARKGKSSTQSLRVWLCPMFLRFRRVDILVHHTSATRGSTKCRAGERVPSCGLAPRRPPHAIEVSMACSRLDGCCWTASGGPTIGELQDVSLDQEDMESDRRWYHFVLPR